MIYVGGLHGVALEAHFLLRSQLGIRTTPSSDCLGDSRASSVAAAILTQKVVQKTN